MTGGVLFAPLSGKPCARDNQFHPKHHKKPPQPSYGGRGADDQIRTDYLVITNDVLYLLSYISARNVHYSELPEQMQALI